MPDLLGISSSALTAVDQWLSTTSHNISNVNTPGYSRETVNLSAKHPTLMGNQFVGNGVQVDSVKREYNTFLTNNVWGTTAQQGQAQTLSDMATQVDNLLANSTTGLSPTLDKFFTAAHGVANDPTSAGARQQVLSTGETVVQTFQMLSTQMQGIGNNVNTLMTTQVTQINNLASSIAKYNVNIATDTAKTDGLGSPNDLADSRDEAVRQLSAIVGVNVFQQPDGTLNVSIGNGQNLVAGSQVRYLNVVNNPYDPAQNEVALGDSANAADPANVKAHVTAVNPASSSAERNPAARHRYTPFRGPIG